MLTTILTADERAAVERLASLGTAEWIPGFTGLEKVKAAEIVARAILRILDSLPAEPVYTIPQWELLKRGSYFADIWTTGCITAERDGMFHLHIPGKKKVKLFPTLELAQQAADADYRERMAKGLTEWKPQ